MIIRLTWLLLIISTLGFGQQAFKTLDLLDSSGTFHIRLVAPGSLSGNSGVTLPVATGAAGCVVDTGGSGILTIGTCILTPPVVLSGSTSGNILTVTQSGAGNALVVTGNSSIITNTSGTTLTLTQSGAGDALHITGGLQLTGGTAQFSGLVTQGPGTPLWYMQANGVTFARNFTSRYTFNSIGDVAQTGTFTASGALITPTSGSFDVSFTGGTIELASTTVTPANGIPFFVSCVNDQANKCGGSQPQGTMLLGSAPGFNGSYSYSANAYQTSTGTMYITGTGFGYFQNLVVTDGLTALDSLHLSGTAVWAGTTVVWVSGTNGVTFDPSMQGGLITLGASAFVVQTVVTPTQITLATSAGGSASGAWSYIGDSFRALDGSGNIVVRIIGDSTSSFAALFNKSVSVVASTGGGGASALSASNTGTGLSAHFGASGGNVLIDTNLTVSGTCTGCGGSGTVTSVATTSPITGGTFSTTGTIGCATCITTSSSKLVQSGVGQFVTGVKIINPTGLTSTAVCVANEGVVGVPTEFVGVSAVSGTSATFTSSNPASGNFFHWECTN